LDLDMQCQRLEFHRAQEESPIMVQVLEGETHHSMSVVTPEQIVQSWVAKAQGPGFERPMASIELEISI
jgi:hypothetical protein